MSTTVVVTGFGPFGKHDVNASWEAVKLLPEHKSDGIRIEVCEIPVKYAYIDEHIPFLWKEYNPQLVVHVGVSDCTESIRIEQQAYRYGYEKVDCEGNLLPTGDICKSDEGENCLNTLLDIEMICEELNKTDKLSFSTSFDAGRYLCEFTYYKSLNIDKRRTLFVHVPVLGKPYSAQELCTGLLDIIKCALKQLNKQDCTCLK